MNPDIQEKKKYSRLSLLSVSGLAVMLLFLLLNLLLGQKPISGPLIFLVLASLFTAIASLIVISRSSEKLKGKGISIPVIIVIYISLIFFSAMNESETKVFDCQDKLGSLLVRFKHYYYLLPNPYQWCDFIIMHEGARPDIFICPASDAVEGESSYALNINIYENKSDSLPRDIVLLFETNRGKGLTRDEPVEKRSFFSAPNFNESYKNRLKGRMVYQERWNQAGGPELIEVGNHRQAKGSNILFADGTIEFVEIQRIPQLRWKIEGKAEFPAFLLEANKGTISGRQLAAIAAVILIVAVSILIKFCDKKFMVFAIIISLISSGIGWFLGLSSSVFYLSDKFPRAAPAAGIAIGFLTGLVYAVFLANVPADFKLSRNFGGFAVSLGLAAAVFCPTIANLIVMALNKTMNPMGLLAALPFGIIAGLILGLISWAALKSTCSKI
jgi:hypothetical protein